MAFIIVILIIIIAILVYCVINLFSNKLIVKDFKNENEVLYDKLAQAKVDIESLDKDKKEAFKSLEKISIKLINDSIKNIFSKLTPNNFTAQKAKINSLYEFCQKYHVNFTKEEKLNHENDLKKEYEKVLRLDYEKKEQARIKAQIREEMQLEKERERELKRLENEQFAIEKALNIALKKAKDEHDVEVERLQLQLKEAQEKSERAKSQAQLTKSGYVYVISNIGSFGKDVFKIGMTRRLEPMDRVKELGDASVPFPFDVHMMISCNDAPALENTLHREFHKQMVNKVNTRKEFFRLNIDDICKVVKAYHGKVEYKAEPEALEYFQSLEMPDEDYEFLTEQEEKLEKEHNKKRGIEELDILKPKENIESEITKEESLPCPGCNNPIPLNMIIQGEKFSCPHCNVKIEVE